ncbi:MAG: hypothetical protein HQ525_10655, partial [Anaerolineae bacterium]|nr:hypothetical protein [Anaerolineae bacterium]
AGNPYYEVFYWGDSNPDTNTNLNSNEPLPSGAIIDPDEPNDFNIDDSGELYGTAPFETGVLIDVDNAPSQPPIGDYPYVLVIAPFRPIHGPTDVDAIELVDEPPPP